MLIYGQQSIVTLKMNLTFRSLSVILPPGHGFTTMITPHGLSIDLIWFHSGNSSRWITLTDPVIPHPEVTAGLEAYSSRQLISPLPLLATRSCQAASPAQQVRVHAW